MVIMNSAATPKFFDSGGHKMEVASSVFGFFAPVSAWEDSPSHLERVLHRVGVQKMCSEFGLGLQFCRYGLSYPYLNLEQRNWFMPLPLQKKILKLKVIVLRASPDSNLFKYYIYLIDFVKYI